MRRMASYHDLGVLEYWSLDRPLERIQQVSGGRKEMLGDAADSPRLSSVHPLPLFLLAAPPQAARKALLLTLEITTAIWRGISFNQGNQSSNRGHLEYPASANKRASG